MAKRGNSHHKPAGTPDGGQFTSASGICVRPNPMENDIESYTKNSKFGNRDPLYKGERVRNINKALYDGGYLERKGSTLNGFENEEEAEAFLTDITTNHASTESWRDHKELVDTYLSVAKGFFTKEEFDLVIDGKRSRDGSARVATELTSEFGWDKKAVGKILMGLTSDDFVNSGKNDSEYEPNKGTVVMVFAPTVRARNEFTEKSTEIDLYVKMVLNPHPDKSRNQTEMQVLSVREAKNKVCLYTGEEKNGRREL